MDNNSIAIIGSTGSIGTQSLDVARKLNLRVTALAAGHNAKLLAKQCAEFKPKTVSICEDSYAELKELLSGTDIKILCGDEGLNEIAYEDESKKIVNAVMGIKGLMPTVYAAKAGKKIAFANKETLVAGGSAVKKIVKENNSELLPVDSEHSAIYQ